MADNFDFTEGSGKTGAADDVSGVLFAKVKLDLGTDGVSAPVLAGAGAVATGVQRVTLASDDPAVALLTTIDSDTNTIQSDTTSIDGKITACNTGAVVLATGSAAIGKLAANTGIDIGDVDVTSVIAGVGATNLGKARDSALGATDTGVMALAIRDDTLTTLTPADGDYVPLRVSSTGQLHVTGAGGGTEYTEDVVTANPQVGSAIMMERDDALTTVTPAEADWIGLRGTAEGALWTQDFNSDAILSDTNAMVTDLAAIEVLLGTIDTDTGNIVTAVQLIDDAIYIDDADWSDGSSKHMLVGGLYQSSPQSITDGDVGPFQVDADGALHISDGGNTITIDGDIGTVTTVTTVSTVTNLSQLGGTAITMDEGVHDAGCQRVTIATDDDAVAHLATIAGDTTAIEAAVEIMDDWDSTHDSAASADGPQLMVAYDSTKPTAVGDADAVRVLADAYGRLLAGVEPQAFQAVYDSADASGEGEAVHASAASTIIVVQSYIISSDAEIWVKLQEEDSTALTGKFWLKAGGGVAITLPDKAPIVLGVDSDLEVITEGAGNVSVSVTGYTIPG